MGASTRSSTRNAWTPRRSPGYPAILFFPSSGGSSDQYYDASNATTGPRARLLQRLNDLGFPCIADAMGGANLFGNATATTAVAAAYTASQSLTFRTGTPVICVACSMGNTTAVNWARQNTSKCLGIVSAFGLTDLVDAYVNNRAGLGAAVGTAWGVTSPTPLPSNASPLANASELGSIPWRGWGASDDTTCPPSTQTAFASAVTDGVYTQLGAIGHDDDVITTAFDAMVATVIDMAT